MSSSSTCRAVLSRRWQRGQVVRWVRGLSETTVKTHVGHILSKLDLRDRIQAVIAAYDAGLVR